MTTDAIRAIADAVLYEGYLLWPYRRSALKNQQRWTFGGLYPEAFARAAGSDASSMQTECLLECGADAVVTVEVRFLHVVARRLWDTTDGGREPADTLVVDGERHLAWDEATERRITMAPLAPGTGAIEERQPVHVPAGGDEEPLVARDGRQAGILERRWESVDALLAADVVALRPGLHRLRVVVQNVTPWMEGGRSAAQRRALLSTHTILRTTSGGFVSCTDPPPALQGDVAACRNVGTWPVLAGEPGQSDVVLSSPIVLSDHPRIAPESPGDLFDGCEIDQLLVLSILSLTDAERDEMRATDARARAILDRCAGLSPAELMRLHGTLRGGRP